MTGSSKEYVFSQAPNEIERLQSWAKSWEPETEALLDSIPVHPGWRCLDLACGPSGIIGPLSRRAGPGGQVVGIDISPTMLAAARSFAEGCGLTNIEFIEANAYETSFPRESFDLVHARFMFAPLGNDELLLNEMIALTRPGGVIISQESDESSYVCEPHQPAWERLKQMTVAAFKKGGGDYSAGRRVYGLFRRAGVEDIHARVATLVLPAGHPYRMWPIESAFAFRKRFLEWGFVTETELELLLQECERIARDPEILLTSFAVFQVWGRKPKMV